MQYRVVEEFVVLPVVVNDSLELNFVLDTGTSTTFLFGKKFQGALGKEYPIAALKNAHITLGNSIKITPGLRGDNLGIAISTSRHFLDRFPDVHGVIGYDLLAVVEIEVSPRSQTVSFRSPFRRELGGDYHRIPIKLTGARPMIKIDLVINQRNMEHEVMIDTGSLFGLILRTEDITNYGVSEGTNVTIGSGLGGRVRGYPLTDARGMLNEREILGSIYVVQPSWLGASSLGMNFFKEHNFVLNYAKEYLGIEKCNGLESSVVGN